MIQVTDNAVAKIKIFLEKEEEEFEGLRVAIKSGGCSGFSYDLFFDQERDGDDIKWFGNVLVMIDAESSPYLDGAILDYKESLLGAGFKIENPNATRQCGCGSSFS